MQHLIVLDMVVLLRNSTLVLFKFKVSLDTNTAMQLRGKFFSLVLKFHFIFCIESAQH